MGISSCSLIGLVVLRSHERSVLATEGRLSRFKDAPHRRDSDLPVCVEGGMLRDAQGDFLMF